MVYQPSRAQARTLAAACYLVWGSMWSAPSLAATCPAFKVTTAPSTTASVTANLLAAADAVAPVSLELHAGLLKPQLETLLQQQFAVAVVDWQVSVHHRWPTDLRLTAPSWPELLRRLLRPYGMQLSIHSNHTAVVRYQTESAT